MLQLYEVHSADRQLIMIAPMDTIATVFQLDRRYAVERIYRELQSSPTVSVRLHNNRGYWLDKYADIYVKLPG